MSAKQKFETIEAAAEAMGVEINEKTTPFLETFVKKEKSASTSEKKKAFFEQAELFGVPVDADKENTQSLIIKIAGHLFSEGMTEELTSFAAEHNIVVTEEGRIFHKKQGVKPIAERNSGGKEGSVGYNTILLLKDEELVDKTPAELADILMERFGQKSTPASISWYINYCKQKGIEICDRKRTKKSAKVEGGVTLGAELTLDKAYAPKGFKKKEKPAGEEATIDPETLEVEGEEA